MSKITTVYVVASEGCYSPDYYHAYFANKADAEALVAWAGETGPELFVEPMAVYLNDITTEETFNPRHWSHLK